MRSRAISHFRYGFNKHCRPRGGRLRRSHRRPNPRQPRPQQRRSRLTRPRWPSIRRRSSARARSTWRRKPNSTYVCVSLRVGRVGAAACCQSRLLQGNVVNVVLFGICMLLRFRRSPSHWTATMTSCSPSRRPPRYSGYGASHAGPDCASEKASWSAVSALCSQNVPAVQECVNHGRFMHLAGKIACKSCPGPGPGQSQIACQSSPCQIACEGKAGCCHARVADQACHPGGAREEEGY
jgi:hypothetical protein